MDFLKQFDIESLEKLASSIASVEEFPSKSQALPSASAPDSSNLLAGVTFNRTRQAVDAWQSISIEQKRPDWEETCIQIKKLAHITPDSSVWEERAKDAEYKLLRIYSMLLDAPDPVPLLSTVSALSSRVLELEAVNRQLATEASSASADAQEVQTLIQDHRQLQTDHKALKDHLDKVVDEISGAHELAEAGKKAMSELDTQADELLRLQTALKASKDECEEAQTRLFEIQQERDQEAGSRTREADVILVDLERSQKKIQELQAQLVSQSNPVLPSSNTNTAYLASSNSFWEQQIDSRMAQIAALEQQLEASRVTLREEASRHELLLQQANNTRASLEIQLDQLKHELGKRPGLKQYEDIVQRVEALQLLVDLQMESEGWNLHPPPSSSSSSRPSDAITSLISAQAAMQERNRKLSSDVTSLKQRLVEAQGSREDAERKLATAQSECNRLSQLARKLEGDLTLTSAPSAPQGGMRDDPTLTLALTPPPSASSKGGMSQGGGGVLDGSSLVEIVASQRDRFRSRVNQLEEEKTKSQEDLARARKQLDEVRADNVSLYEKLRFLERYQGQQQEASGALGGSTGVRVAVMKVDEAGIRQEAEEDRKAGRYQCGPFAVEINNSTQPPEAPAPGSSPSSSFLFTSSSSSSSKVRSRAKAQRMIAGCFPADAVEMEGDEEAPTPQEQRYKRDYEARFNPFAEFQKSEVDQRLQRMPVHDRALLAGSKALVGSKFARALAAVYMVLMHIFFFVLLYYALSPVGCGSHTIEVVDATKLTQLKDAASIASGPK